MNLEELKGLYDFSGRSIVITGGAGILGGEMACALVGCHANVAIMDRDPALADRLIHPDTNFNGIRGLKAEAAQVLMTRQPVSLAAASRLQGVTPADIAVLSVWLDTQQKSVAVESPS